MSAPLHELAITRHIAAPPAKVWHVMTERMAEWWCPVPWRTEIVTLERRAGGRCAMTMFGPDGESHPQDGILLAWDEGKRFVFTDAVVLSEDGGFVPTGPFMIGSFEIAAEGEGTRYTASSRHWTEEAHEQHKAMGFEQGWNAVADQLAALCEAS